MVYQRGGRSLGTRAQFPGRRRGLSSLQPFLLNCQLPIDPVEMSEDLCDRGEGGHEDGLSVSRVPSS